MCAAPRGAPADLPCLDELGQAARALASAGAPGTESTAFKIVVYRAAPAGGEVFLVRAGEAWSFPEGTSRMGERPHEASADAADSGLFEPI